MSYFVANTLHKRTWVVFAIPGIISSLTPAQCRQLIPHKDVNLAVEVQFIFSFGSFVGST